MVAKEVAELEINKWLDYKRVKDKKREAYKDAIETLIDAVSEGYLVVNEDFTLTHSLAFPVGAEGAFKELVYKPRIDVATIQKYANGAIGGDARVLATIAALSGQATTIISKMDTEDYGIASSVAIFFL